MNEKEIKYNTMALLYRQLELLERRCVNEPDVFNLAKMSDQMAKVGSVILGARIEDEFSENTVKVMQKFLEVGENPSASEISKANLDERRKIK